MEFWKTIVSELKTGHNLVLMYVIESSGSSPGRQGFKMAVSGSGLLIGSIGGGIMEHKLVELCKSELLKAPFTPFIKKQIHQADISANKSGMICSGEQTIAFYHLSQTQHPLIEEIIKTLTNSNAQLILTQEGIQIANSLEHNKFNLRIENNQKWKLTEQFNLIPQLHIIGGGHVSLALSKFANEVGFGVTVSDDRSSLNTMEQNQFATTLFIDDYKSISSNIPNPDQAYVVIMSFGYKTDKLILKSLLDVKYTYLGMMGSQSKIKTLFEELREEGIAQNTLDRVFAPIGLPIKSKTPEEIAISILGQLIKEKNN